MRAAGFVITEVLLLIAILRIGYRIFEWSRTTEVAEVVPDFFPVVVVTPTERSGEHRAQVLFQHDLARFLDDHPLHSFLIPEAETAGLRAQVEADTRSHGMETSDLLDATFDVRRRADGSQALEVVAESDATYENKSWYEVRGESIVARRYVHYSGPAVGMMILPALGATALNLALWRKGDAR